MIKFLAATRMLDAFRSNRYEVHGDERSGMILYHKGVARAANYRKSGIFSPPRVLIWPADEDGVERTETIAKRYTQDVRRLPNDTPHYNFSVKDQTQTPAAVVGRFFDRIYEELGKHESPRWDEIARTLGPD